jgi:hypothetical protein
MTSFWQDLNHPLTVLPPMDEITNMVFRNIMAEIGKPISIYKYGQT